MNRLRLAFRRLRLYYKSVPYLRSIYGSNAPLLSLPFRRGKMEFLGPNGITLVIPSEHWRLLPSVTKLAAFGARTTIFDDYKCIEIDGLKYFAPIEPRGEAVFFREIFRDDVYEVASMDFQDKIVIDIGAHIGDFAIFLASRGAIVHAFEPSKQCGTFLQRNAIENCVADRVVFHNVGLSNYSHTESLNDDQMHFVATEKYPLEAIPSGIDLIKMDCEGCEYYLFEVPGFLEHIAAKCLVMEFHYGSSKLVKRLNALGYTVRVKGDADGVGYIYASHPDNR